MLFLARLQLYTEPNSHKTRAVAYEEPRIMFKEFLAK